MRVLFLDALNFLDDELQFRLFSYCEKHFMDCIFISNDSDSTLKKRLSIKLADRPVRIFNESQTMRYNGVIIYFDTHQLEIEGQLVYTYPGTCTYVNVQNKKLKTELIYMNIFSNVSANPEKNLKIALENILDELLDSEDMKDRKFN